MKRLGVVAVLVWAAGCGGDGDGGTVSKRYVYHGQHGSSVTQAVVERRIHGDGSETLHGETTHDYPLLEFRAEIIEDVALASDGSLASADMHVRVKTGTTVHEKRVIADAGTGIVSVTRPSGHTLWNVPTDFPWSYYAWGSDPFWTNAMATPISGWVFARARTLSPKTRYFVYDLLGHLVVSGFEGGEMPSSWTVYNDEFEVAQGDDFMTSFSPAFMGLDAIRVDDVEPAPLDLHVAEGTNPIPFPECGIAGTATKFTVTSSDGTVVHGQIDVPDAPAVTRPFVVLNVGTGGADREQLEAGVPRLRCLAAPLVAAGIAVVRWDERGYGETGGDAGKLTFTQRSQDAAAVARFVAALPDVDPAGLFLFGHSEGVAHVSDAAVAVPEVDGLILAGGIGGTGREIVLEQVDAHLTNYGYSAGTITLVVDYFEDAIVDIEQGVRDEWQGHVAEFWREFFLFDGAAKAAAAARPSLILQGGRDPVVPPRHADLLADAIRGAGVADVTVKVYPQDGHFFIPTRPDFPSCGDEETLPNPPDAALITDMIDWIHAR